MVQRAPRYVWGKETEKLAEHYYMLHWSYKDICRTLNVPMHSLKYKVAAGRWSAKRKLRDWLKFKSRVKVAIQCMKIAGASDADIIYLSKLNLDEEKLKELLSE